MNPAEKNPSYREANECRNCVHSTLTDINDGVMPHLVLLCGLYDNSEVKAHFVCDDYKDYHETL